MNTTTVIISIILGGSIGALIGSFIEKPRDVYSLIPMIMLFSTMVAALIITFNQ